MAINNAKYFRMFKGLTYRVPDLITGETYATDLKNVNLTEQFGLSKRQGFYNYVSGHGGNGAVTYRAQDVGFGTQTEERLIADEVLKKVNTQQVQIVIDPMWVGPTPTSWTVSLELDPETQTFKFKIEEDGDLFFSYDLGTGLEITPFTIKDLQTELALTDYYRLTTSSNMEYLTGGGGADVPAAFIEPAYNVGAVADSVTLTYKNLTVIDSFDSFEPFALHWANRTDPDWEINSIVQIHNCVYFTNKDDGLIKYDGAKVYRAGVPGITNFTSASAGFTGLTPWRYLVVVEHEDNQGNIIQSRPSNILSVDPAGGPYTDLSFDLDTNDIPILNQGYPLADLEFKLFRTVAGGTEFYLVDTKTYADASVENVITFDSENETDDNLINAAERYTIPLLLPNIPPKCQYMDTWRNQIVLTGEPTSQHTVYIADVSFIEGFPLGNQLETGSRRGGPNTGIKSRDNTLFVFKATAINAITGDITAGATNVQVDTISDSGIGALSHNSIVEAMNKTYFISQTGVYSVSSQGITPESDDLLPIFSRYTFKENRITSFHWVNEDKVLFLLPEYNNAGVMQPALSRVLVKDLQMDSWYVWNNLDFSCGIDEDKQQIWFVGQNYVSDLRQFNRTEDYADHNLPVNFEYKTHWESLNDPSILKKFNRIKVYSLDNEIKTFDSSTFLLDISTNHDFRDVPVSQTTIQFGGGQDSGYGNDPYGLLPYGSVKIVDNTKRLSTKPAKSIRVIFSNNVVNENVLISGFELEVATQYLPGLRDGQ